MKTLEEDFSGRLDDVERWWIRIPAVLLLFIPFSIIQTILHVGGFFLTGCDPDAIFSWFEHMASWLDMCRPKLHRKWER